VSAKVAGETASLKNPALDRILDFAAEAGLVVLIHNDMDVPFAKSGAKPAYLSQMGSLLRRHPNTTIIWAHTGIGRVVRSVAPRAAKIEEILRDPECGHVYFDISWDEVATDFINRYPDRFLFGTDEVAPPSQEKYLAVYEQYRPLWSLLNPEPSEKVRKSNYERIFDRARHSVRTWEAIHMEPSKPGRTP
jgi:predicted TIM-barrel fold metal-dependent hydrolase